MAWDPNKRVSRFSFYLCLLYWWLFRHDIYKAGIIHALEWGKYTTPERIFWCKRRKCFIMDWRYEDYKEKSGKEYSIPRVSRFTFYAALLFNKLFYPSTFENGRHVYMDWGRKTTPERIEFRKGIGLWMEWHLGHVRNHSGKEYTIPRFLQ